MLEKYGKLFWRDLFPDSVWARVLGSWSTSEKTSFPNPLVHTRRFGPPNENLKRCYFVNDGQKSTSTNFWRTELEMPWKSFFVQNFKDVLFVFSLSLFWHKQIWPFCESPKSVRATTITISGLIMSKGSLIVDDDRSAGPGHEKLWKACTRRMTKGKMTSCLRKISSCQSHPGAVDGKDQRHMLVQGVWMDKMLADVHVGAA